INAGSTVKAPHSLPTTASPTAAPIFTPRSSYLSWLRSGFSTSAGPMLFAISPTHSIAALRSAFRGDLSISSSSRAIRSHSLAPTASPATCAQRPSSKTAASSTAPLRCRRIGDTLGTTSLTMP
ncbi:hypothetical protein C9890_0393, partial [Perkinsus sp. BL_2016]